MMIAAGAAGTGTFKAEIKLKSIVIRIQESILKTQVIQKNVKDIFQKKKHYSESQKFCFAHYYYNGSKTCQLHELYILNKK